MSVTRSAVPARSARRFQAELAHEGLGRAVHVAARVRPIGGRRAEVEHMSAIALDHAGQQRARDLHESGAVGVDHRRPFIEIRAMRGLETERKAGIVDEHVDVCEFGRQRGGHSLHGCAVAHVQFEGQQVVAQFAGEASRRSLRRAVATTRWPPFTKARAMAAPNPADAPVTNTIIAIPGCWLGKATSLLPMRRSSNWVAAVGTGCRQGCGHAAALAEVLAGISGRSRDPSCEFVRLFDA